MSSPSLCRRCNTELGAGTHAKETTRAHSVPRFNTDGSFSRYVVVLCNACFTALDKAGELDSFAEQTMKAFPKTLPDAK